MASKNTNPQKFLLEGGSSLDVELQNALIQIIQQLETRYGITLVIVIDGLVPKYLSEKQQNILQKSWYVWDQLLTADEQNNQDLFFKILETYGSRCFMSEVINAAIKTNTKFFVAPYFSTPQIVHFFRSKMVQAVIGSLSCMFCEFESIDSQGTSDPEDLTQVITSLDLENGSFTFVDKIDIIASFNLSGNANDQVESITDLFIIFGQLYGIQLR